MDRCLHILKEGPHIQIATINDAIEAQQLKLTFETVPELFEKAEDIDVASIRGRRSRLRESLVFTRNSRCSTPLSSGAWCTPAAQRR